MEQLDEDGNGPMRATRGPDHMLNDPHDDFSVSYIAVRDGDSADD